MLKRPEENRLAEVGRLYDRLAPALFRYAVMILASPTEAEDVVHRVFVRLLQRDLSRVAEIDGYTKVLRAGASQVESFNPFARLASLPGGCACSGGRLRRGSCSSCSSCASPFP